MRTLAFFVSLLLVVSCNQKPGSQATGSETGQNGNPVIEFDTTAHDYGTLIEGEVVSFTFKFENQGDGPLLIKSASASCGCTVPNYSKEPTLPGGGGKIVVEFDTRGRVGSNHKTVSIRTNSNPPVTILDIYAEVVRDER